MPSDKFFCRETNIHVSLVLDQSINCQVASYVCRGVKFNILHSKPNVQSDAHVERGKLISK